MDQRDVERVIKEMMVDDYYGLWEIVWALNHEFPGEGRAEKRKFGEAAVRKLLDEGALEVYRGSEFKGEQYLVGPDRLDESLADAWWDPHGDEEHTRIIASQEYRRWYGRPN